jgi:hypothetical protein
LNFGNASNAIEDGEGQKAALPLSADRGEIHQLPPEYEISQDAIIWESVEMVNPKIPGAQKLPSLTVD